MSVGALVSKGLGLVREVMLARYFGTGPVADAYRSALTLTLSPAHLLTTHTIQTCFIPLYTRMRGEDPARAAALFQGLLAIFLGAGLLLGVGLLAGAGILAKALLPGFDPDRQALTAAMLRIMALGVPAYIYYTLLASMAAGQRDYTLPIYRPGLQNLGLLAMIIVAVALHQPVLAAYGFTLTYVVMAVAGTWLLRARGQLPVTWHLRRRDFGQLAGAFWRPLRPLLWLSLLVQAGILVERFLSSLVGPGTVAALDYARFITETTHALLLMPLGLVSLARFADVSEEHLRETADRLLTLMMLLLVPVSVFLVVAGGPVVQVLYERGAFDRLSQQATHLALVGLGAGLWAVSGAYFLRNVLHARARNGVVLVGEGLAVAVNVAFVLCTYRRLGILALGLGPSLGALAALGFYVHRLDLRAGTSLARLGLMLGGTLPYGAIALALQPRVGSGWPQVLAQGAWAIVFWSLWIGAFPALRNTLHTLRRTARS
jgi:murein biosynthesis integral membrane protein MurJ